MQKTLHICGLYARHSNCEALQLSSGKLADLTVKYGSQLELVEDILKVVTFKLALEHLLDGLLALDSARNVIDILWLDEWLQVVLEHLGEVVLQLGSTEVAQDFLPVWWVL
jgi:hypothetical protein